MTKKLKALRAEWAIITATEPERLDAKADEWLRQHRTATVKESFRLAMLIASARMYASDLRAKRAARLRLAYSQGC
tara:strand:+ start:474 stop:701 length:228 start_codon:yes stop_codon:yes gene_type:complete